MRIGELSRRSDLSRDTIRFYERSGLIRSAPSASASNSFRDYSEDALDRLAMIREAQRAGFSIAELALFVEQMEGASPADFDAEDFLQKKIEEVEENIRRSRTFLKTLKATKNALSPLK